MVTDERNPSTYCSLGGSADDRAAATLAAQVQIRTMIPHIVIRFRGDTKKPPMRMRASSSIITNALQPPENGTASRATPLSREHRRSVLSIKEAKQ
jgi:hypothetical protein